MAIQGEPWKRQKKLTRAFESISEPDLSEKTSKLWLDVPARRSRPLKVEQHIADAKPFARQFPQSQTASNEISAVFTVLHPNAMDRLHPVQRLAFDERELTLVAPRLVASAGCVTVRAKSHIRDGFDFVNPRHGSTGLCRDEDRFDVRSGHAAPLGCRFREVRRAMKQSQNGKRSLPTDSRESLAKTAR